MARTARGAGFLAAQSAIGVIIGTVLYIYQTRALTKEEMGVYAAVFLVQNSATVLGTLGFDFAASRFIPFLKGRGDSSGLKFFTKWVLFLSMASASAFGLAYFFLAPTFSVLMLGSDSYAYVFQLDSLVVFLGIMGLVLMGHVQGLQKYLRLAAFKLLAQIIRVGTSVALLLGGLGVVSIYYGWASYYVLLVALSLPFVIFLLKIRASDADRGNVQNVSVRSLFAFSTPIMVYGALLFMSTSLDQFFVLSAGAEALGAYSVAVTGGLLISQTIVSPLQQTLTSGLSEVHGRSLPGDLKDSLEMATRLVGMLFLPMIAGLVALAPVAIFVLAGASYPESVLPFSVICLGMSFLGFSTLILSTLVALGETRKVMLAYLGSIIVQFALGSVLTPVLGLLGASLSRASMYAVGLLLFLKLGGDSAKLKIEKRFLGKVILSSVAMGLIVYLTAFFTQFRLLFLPLYVVIGIGMYGIGLAVMKIVKAKDIAFFFSIIPLGEKMRRMAKRTLASHKTLNQLYKRLATD